MTSNAIIPGSLSAIAAQSGRSIAETFVSADCVVLVDTSASMENNDSRGNKTRYDVACEELAALQRNLPGKIAVISFSSEPQFCPNGVPTFLMASTDMAQALQFAKMADIPPMRFILISDGEPDDRDKTLKIARTYQNKIDTVYVGPETMRSGREFLTELAQVSGGQTVTADRAKELASKIQYLLGQ